MAVLQTIKEQTYDIIMKKILTQEYPLGSRINIGQLSQELGVSNSPIREALNLLEQQGLVVTVRNSGISVVNLSQRDRYELSQMTLFWLTGSYNYCREVGHVRQLCDSLEAELTIQKECYERKDVYEFNRHANLFDRCFIAATGNNRLLMQFDALFPLLFLGSLYNQENWDRDWRIGLEQHEKILLAVQEDRSDEAIEALGEHYYKPLWDLRERES